MSRLVAMCVMGALVGCSDGGSEFESLYDPPSGTTTAGLLGTWGGAISGNDLRWVLEPDRVTIANKCGSTIVGVAVSAEVTTTQIRIIESKQDSTDACFVNATPGVLRTCPTDATPREDCFEHAMKQLTLYASEIDFIELTKIED